MEHKFYDWIIPFTGKNGSGSYHKPWYGIIYQVNKNGALFYCKAKYKYPEDSKEGRWNNEFLNIWIEEETGREYPFEKTDMWRIFEQDYWEFTDKQLEKGAFKNWPTWTQDLWHNWRMYYNKDSDTIRVKMLHEKYGPDIILRKGDILYKGPELDEWGNSCPKPYKNEVSLNFTNKDNPNLMDYRYGDIVLIISDKNTHLLEVGKVCKVEPSKNKIKVINLYSGERITNLDSKRMIKINEGIEV